MKKRMFRMLCVVLALALLAPNVFAATPPPEVPLADETTVTRVKNEIAAGEITDMEDVFLVAYQHLGADLEEEGMTAYINEDGTLGLVQIIENDNADASAYTLNDGSVERTIAVMSLGSYDGDGRLLNDYTYETYPFNRSDSDDNGVVNVTHTMYITGEKHSMYGLTRVKLDRISTTIIHTSASYVSSELVQAYKIEDGYGDIYPLRGSRTIAGPSTGTHTYYPGDTGWYGPTNGNLGGSINTSSTVTVVGIDDPIHIDLTFEFEDAERWFGFNSGEVTQ